MKGKTLLSLAIVISMMLAALPLVAVKASPTSMEISFENGLNAITKNVCNNFVATVEIVGAPAMTQYIVELDWDPAVLELETGTEGDFTQGPFLGGAIFLVTLSVDPGHVDEVTEARLTGTKSGSGDAFYIAFHAKGPGVTEITLVRHLMYNGLIPIANDAINGTVTVLPPPATPPDAEFTPDAGTRIPVCTDVVLDGTMSVDGHDTVIVDEDCPIVQWRWDIDFHNGSPIVTLYGDIAGFHCDGPGMVTINLTVYAPDPHPPSAPDYDEYNSEIHVIYQEAAAVGCQLDVFTDRGGGSPDAPEIFGKYPFPWGWSDAYGPQEEVCVYAKITYNEEPVEYKPVGFEMIDKTGTSRDFRTAFTNSSGIAKVCFRIPWEGSHAEDLFGVWTIYGTADIAGTIQTDLVKFKFGYIVSIKSVTVTPFTVYKYPKMPYNITIDIELNNISFEHVDVLLTMVASDNCTVPVGVAVKVAFRVHPGHQVQCVPGVTATWDRITIPPWAFVGSATVYVNVFTDYPSAGGIPYCPEKSAAFSIGKT